MKRLPPVPQVVVRTLPESGRRSLFLASHAGRIFGMPDEEGRALIDELIAHVTQRQFVYTHRWRPNELVMWDNRSTQHYAPHDYYPQRRLMERVTVGGDAVVGVSGDYTPEKGVAPLPSGHDLPREKRRPTATREFERG